MKGTSIEVGILNKGLDEIYNVHSDLSSKKRKKKTVHVVTINNNLFHEGALDMR